MSQNPEIPAKSVGVVGGSLEKLAMHAPFLLSDPPTLFCCGSCGSSHVVLSHVLDLRQDEGVLVLLLIAAVTGNSACLGLCFECRCRVSSKTADHLSARCNGWYFLQFSMKRSHRMVCVLLTELLLNDHWFGLIYVGKNFKKVMLNWFISRLSANHLWSSKIFGGQIFYPSSPSLFSLFCFRGFENYRNQFVGYINLHKNYHCKW